MFSSKVLIFVAIISLLAKKNGYFYASFKLQVILSFSLIDDEFSSEPLEFEMLQGLQYEGIYPFL